MLHQWCNRNAGRLALALFASGLIATGWSFDSSGASATQPKYGSLLVQTDAPGGGLANGYCLTASGPSTFTTAGSGTDGNLGEINQANVVPGKYVGSIYDCGAQTGGTSNGNVKFTITANTTFTATYQLVAGGSIVGQVLDSNTGVGAPYVSVTVYDVKRQIVLQTACTDSDGNFSYGGLPLSPGVKVYFAGPGNACNNNKSYTPQWYAGTSYATAATIVPDANCCGTQLDPTTLTATSTKGQVTITSLTITGSTANPSFTVAGTGFGTEPSGTAPICSDETSGAGEIFGSKLNFNDYSSAPWQAGFGNDCIGLVVTSWSSTSITFTLGSWYAGPGAAQGTALNAGDPYTLVVHGAHLTGVVGFS
jgi:hypothetical protein